MAVWTCRPACWPPFWPCDDDGGLPATAPSGYVQALGNTSYDQPIPTYANPAVGVFTRDMQISTGWQPLPKYGYVPAWTHDSRIGRGFFTIGESPINWLKPTHNTLAVTVDGYGVQNIVEGRW